MNDLTLGVLIGYGVGVAIAAAVCCIHDFEMCEREKDKRWLDDGRKIFFCATIWPMVLVGVWVSGLFSFFPERARSVTNFTLEELKKQIDEMVEAETKT